MVWGGKSLRVIKISIDRNYGVTLAVSSAEFLTPDWLMSGCAAVAGQPNTAFLITANNALLMAKVEDGYYAQYSKRICIYQLVTSVKCILYAADIVALSPSHVLIASGTAFGEIVVWSCFIIENEPSQLKAVGSIHHYFTGHDGSVFGVRIFPNISSLNGGRSGRLLASCSDDRTVRIWDITDCETKSPKDPSAYSTDGFELRSTGYGSGLGTEACVAKAFGHAARIWNVIPCPAEEDNPNTLGLVSRGEDRTCVVWELSWETPSSGTTKYQLREMSSAQPHLGRHIWAFDLCEHGVETIVYTGGADGALKSFKVRKHVFSPSQYNTPGQNNPTSQKKISDPDAPRTIDFVSPDCLIACSLRSELRLGHVSPTDNAKVTWETLCTAEDLRSYSLITGIPTQRLALIANSQGLVRLYSHSTRSVIDLVNLGKRPRSILIAHEQALSDHISIIVHYYAGEEATLMTVTGWETSCPQAEVRPFSLPKAPYIVTAAALLYNGKYLLLGSELGGLAVYQTAGLGLSSKPLVDKRRIHGHEGTTSIRAVKPAAGEQEYILTCGRDGNYCYHELQVRESESVTVSLETLDQTSSGLGQDLWGVYLEEVTGDLMVYGFRSQNFVLRNETIQQDVISIASGGARRVWSYQPGTETSKPLLAWLEKPNLQVMRIQTDANRSIRAGGHGREIRTMDGMSAVQGRGSYFATGAEDTIVRIFAASSQANEGPWGSFKCLRILDKHRSGIQQVSWSKDGRYLFTSAGQEEVFVWGITWLPSCDISVKMVADCPKSDPDSEMRITSFDLVEVEESHAGKGFLLCLTLSNSTIRIFHFSPSELFRFTLLAQGTYMTNCLTQTKLWVKDSSVNLITAATDGYFTLWDLTDTLESFYDISSSILKAKRSFEGSSIIPEDIACESRYRVHSNSTKAMELVPLSDTAAVIVTASDDCSINVSLLRTRSADPDADEIGVNACVSTVSIPDAHAASVTALKILRQEVSATASGLPVSRLTFVTSGNDHRLKLWSITVDPTKQGTEGMIVEFLLDRYSAVADIASLGFLPELDSQSGKTQGKLLVGGAGMEMLEARLM
ncbi:Regulator of Ty1 transposition protein 10 [Penicillium subrubescens]|uniref:Regulator of Ty1 transposition protein 10 n=2 Tax=Penicillium subrubescens TaxID=1316194 RepID=A0A1Q5UQN5_9EURO|nr:Regulator of Ty1 transposition protein 10 [Penicillium subrubescens]